MSASPFLPLLLLLFAAAAPPSTAARIPFTTSTAEAEEAAALPFLSETVHDLLPKYGLPPGLLPASVTSYSMDEKGEFVVKLANPCYVKFTDLVYYASTITGKLTYGSISDLSGIEVKKVFVWLPITGMVADADGKSIEFLVGFLSEKLPVSLFLEIPTCRDKASSHGAPCAAAAAAAAAAAVEAF